ncbi:hypothetical protein EZJ19_15105 [Parasulfuritortus cantonensis]|uniref:Uncharacterized protein n=1 Tax=Parasulfuritortus cantonensis TaxID=2528202 RepID=A0A4R1B2D4_9PROT|nr:hypothetical protein [Parasulfuritortus cantonensis]TCJ11600.1 hypothetical protein EZJ19_15105 [Parasulfuritortus cantonensis]
MSQSVFTTVYRYWNWIGIPVLLVAAVVLWLTITDLIAVVKRSYLFSVPLASRQDIQFAEPGRVTLSMEGPRFTTRFGNANFELRDAAGVVVAGRPSLMRLRSSGMTTVRMELLSFDIPRPGRYTLDITGLGEPREGDDKHAVVFQRPALAPIIIHVVGIVLSAGLFITSLVFFILRLNEAGWSS